MVDRKEFGEFIRNMRNAAGFSQQDIAKSTGYRNKSSISEFEKGKRLPSDINKFEKSLRSAVVVTIKKRRGAK